VKVRDVLQARVIALRRRPGYHALARDRGIRHLVVMRAGELVGIVSDRLQTVDRLSAESHDRALVEASLALSVGEMMTPTVMTVEAESPIAEARQTHAAAEHQRLPVVERPLPCGSSHGHGLMLG
jgi:CBS domain-containing protein